MSASQFSNPKGIAQAMERALRDLAPTAEHLENIDREGAAELAVEHIRAAAEQLQYAGLPDLAMKCLALVSKMEGDE